MSTRRPVPPEFLLGAGATAGGIGALVFVAVGTRHLGLGGFSPLSQLWTVWAIAAAVLTFSYQQVVIRRSWARAADREPLLVVVPVAAALAVAAGTHPVRTRLFGSDSPGWVLAAAAIPVGCALIGATRGRWAARERYAGLALMVGGENTIRALAAVALALVGASSPWFAAAILVGFLPALVVPRGRPSRDTALADASSTRTLTGAALSGLLSHGTLVIAPVLAAAAGRPGDEVSALFAYLALTRAPYQIAQGIVPRAADRWTGWAAHGAGSDFVRLHRFVVGATAAAVVLAAGASVVVGDRVAGLFFASAGVLDAPTRGLAAVLVVLAVANLAFTVVAISEGRATRASAHWIVAVLVVGAVGIVTRPSSPLTVVALPVAVETLVFAALAVDLGLRHRPARRPGYAASARPGVDVGGPSTEER